MHYLCAFGNQILKYLLASLACSQAVGSKIGQRDLLSSSLVAINCWLNICRLYFREKESESNVFLEYVNKCLRKKFAENFKFLKII